MPRWLVEQRRNSKSKEWTINNQVSFPTYIDAVMAREAVNKKFGFEKWRIKDGLNGHSQIGLGEALPGFPTLER